MHHEHLSERRVARIARHHDYGSGAPGTPRASYYGSDSERWPALRLAFDQDPLACAERAIHQEYLAALHTGPAIQLKPLSFDDRSGNALRPSTFATMVGQSKLKGLLKRIVQNVRTTGTALDHVLLVGDSGTGKTTTAMVLANELGRRCFMFKPPIEFATLEAAAQTCQDGDVIILDEVHLLGNGDRRGAVSSPDPEALFAIMEERRLITPHGVMPFPAVSLIGTTTDAGLIPTPLLNRFPLRPVLEPYSIEDMAQLADDNAKALGLVITPDAAEMFARASRCNPRTTNGYARNARQLGNQYIDTALAREVIEDLNGTTLDGLDPSMQAVLRYLYTTGRRDTRNGTVYRSSLSNLATASGHGRDTKYLQISVEPWLLRNGLLAVAPQGRELTDAGIKRARQL